MDVALTAAVTLEDYISQTLVLTSSHLTLSLTWGSLPTFSLTELVTISVKSCTAWCPPPIGNVPIEELRSLNELGESNVMPCISCTTGGNGKVPRGICH